MSKHLKILVCADRVGYGHIRGMLGISDMLQEQYGQYFDVEIGMFSELSSPEYREKWKMIDDGLGFLYKYFTDLNVNQDPVDLLNYASIFWEVLAKADNHTFENYVRNNNYDLVIGAHPVIGPLLNEIPGILVGLDPYAELYFSDKKNIIITAVNEKMQKSLYKLGANSVIETGAMIPYPIVEFRKNSKKRILEIQEGKSIRVAIATGGSLTHGEQIIQLTSEFVKLSTINEIEKIFVVVGNSKEMRNGVEKAAGLDSRVEIIFDEDQIKLVRRADNAFVNSDLIIAKTGEIPQCVIPGGKAFKTFHIKPSMGPQEVALRKYPEELSRVNGVSALEMGIQPVDEVVRILKQKQDGTLAQMMVNGLRVPYIGTKKLAEFIVEKYIK